MVDVLKVMRSEAGSVLPAEPAPFAPARKSVGSAGRRCDTPPVLLTPLPGADRQSLLSLLQERANEAGNLRNRLDQLPPFQTFYQYLEWARFGVQALSARVRPLEASAMFQTRRWELLLGVGTDHDIARLLMTQELDDRAVVLKAAYEDLKAEFERWTTPARLLVFDTVVYMEHPQKLEELDFWGLTGEINRGIHLVVPIAVIDELDNLKNRGHEAKKWRAAYSLAVLDRVISGKKKNVAGAVYGHVLRAATRSTGDGPALERGPVTIDLLLDPPDHVRLPNTDDEIVDRAVNVQALAGKPVTLVSYDTGMIMRARNAGLDVIKLVQAKD
ncbi:hypothetical protein KOI35_03935 [Actinoplanes bogorensis]|uniref:PIN domain-containing protein n=1 Tax=Paractinoplanes bogorensis TaxID=1610840 RepID=A0ABS5YGZ3_9ACTN|nr:PIN domain-containing protein [Actinoplanes bogorensis]MBU2662648.1 hypothetical protein [Actinoplanes bogorensis]